VRRSRPRPPSGETPKLLPRRSARFESEESCSARIDRDGLRSSCRDGKGTASENRENGGHPAWPRKPRMPVQEARSPKSLTVWHPFHSVRRYTPCDPACKRRSERSYIACYNFQIQGQDQHRDGPFRTHRPICAIAEKDDDAATDALDEVSWLLR